MVRNTAKVVKTGPIPVTPVRTMRRGTASFRDIRLKTPPHRRGMPNPKTPHKKTRKSRARSAGLEYDPVNTMPYYDEDMIATHKVNAHLSNASLDKFIYGILVST